jgi:hypothetical protein
MATRDDVWQCVMTTLQVALEERFKYPRKPILNDESEPVAKIDALAAKLEQTAYDAVTVDLDDYDKSSQWKARALNSYLSIIAQLVVHTSPSFYVGRHSFVFRDMLRYDELPSNFLDEDVVVLWPEIFDQRYLTNAEYQQIGDIREMEVSVALKGLILLINECCGGKIDIGQKATNPKTTCTMQQRLDALRMGGIFEEGTTFAKLQQTICFGHGNGCWKPEENRIVIPCSSSASVCNDLSEDEKIDPFTEDDVAYFGLCVEYEDFLRSFAEAYHEDEHGDVPDPFGEDIKMNKNVSEQIRAKWGKEIKMMRVYLDNNWTD